MENNTKTYPSQVNTKAMACRVPVADYVKFLQDAISKGISINDWLLMKVYQEPNKQLNGAKLYENTTQEAQNEIEGFPIVFDNGYGTEIVFNDSEEVVNNFLKLIESYNQLQDYIMEQATRIGELEGKLKNCIAFINFSDKENRVQIASKIQSYVRSLDYENEADKKEDLKELRSVLKEVFISE